MSIIPERRLKAAIGFIFVTAVLDIVAMGIIIPVLPQLIEEFVGSNARAGIINGVFVALWAGMQFVASPIIGSLSDQYGRRPVILISCAGLAIDYVLMALAPNLWWLALGRIVAGVTSSSFTTIYAYMADITAPEKRAQLRSCSPTSKIVRRGQPHPSGRPGWTAPFLPRTASPRMPAATMPVPRAISPRPCRIWRRSPMRSRSCGR